jgi:hypothetical protein
LKGAAEPEDAAVKSLVVTANLTEEPESMESASLADIGLGKSVHEQLGSPTLTPGNKKDGARRTSVAEDVARAGSSGGKA